MPKQSSHTHILRRHKYPSGNSVYFCTLPDCHYKIDVPLALGKRSICNICGDEFILSEYSIKLAKPHCDKCGKVKIKDGNGETRYVRKQSNKILTDLATNTIEDLQSRLTGVTSPVSEEDI